ncbi:hypothetical protein [Endozoicomonas sp.]|uniref:hypothetical protein n=1 Tax=Endozoicomonas sp. TaxID=1892382 RepID=UPI003AF9C43E
MEYLVIDNILTGKRTVNDVLEQGADSLTPVYCKFKYQILWLFITGLVRVADPYFIKELSKLGISPADWN